MSKDKKTYYELAVHSKKQIFVFILIFLISFIIVFAALINLVNYTVESYLEGIVYNAGEDLPKIMNTNKPIAQTDYFTAWAIDIYLDTPQEARYWINPILTLVLPVSLISLILTVILTSLLPQKIGLMRQKIEREIIYFLEKIMYKREGRKSEDDYDTIIKEIMNASLRELQDFHREFEISLEDLKVLQRSLYWRKGSFIHKFIHLRDGLTMYMRFYFSEKYSNTVLGLVYIGAAFLIIIIGMRGLKFIPSTQPSMVFFALGLEFSMLVTYAFTLMFSRQDETTGKEISQDMTSDNLFLPSEFGNAKEVENLLKVFIKSSKKSDENS